jgi:hypothetical protein
MNVQIRAEDWGEFADQFSRNNRDRRVSLEIVSELLGDEPQVKSSPLMALDFDPRADQAFMITVGEGERNFTHVVDAPKKVDLRVDELGKALALSIQKEGKDQTIMRFED